MLCYRPAQQRDILESNVDLPIASGGSIQEIARYIAGKHVSSIQPREQFAEAKNIHSQQYLLI